MRSKFSLPIACAALLWCAGCGSDTGPQAPETDEPLYREAQQLERQGRNDEAMNDYLKLIAARGDQAPLSHLSVAVLDLDTFRDPISAIYHFQEFLKLQPNSVQAPFVRGQIEAAKREFASTLPASSWLQGGSPPDLANRLQELEAENAALKAQLAEIRAESAGGVAVRPPVGVDIGSSAEAAPAPATTPAAVLVPAPMPPPTASAAPAEPGRVHVVVPGDGLMKLAREYYGTEARWRDIVAANAALLPDGKNTRLRPGMRLRIP